MKNIIIFGGAFDPIHNGHINMAIKASEVLNAEVFFVPARISVWKKESGASIEDKINMITLAIKDAKKENTFFVSDFEAKSNKDINYSIDTVKHFKKQYPNDNLYFLIGTDQVNSFDRWKNAEEIAKLCQIIYFDRPEYDLDQTMIDLYNMKRIDGELVEESSTEIKQLKSLKIPFPVAKYIVNNNLYFMQKIRSYMGEERYAHSKSVALLAAEIAISNKINDWHKYLRAGLLHDIAKELPKDKQKELMNRFYRDYLDMPPVIYHQFLGAHVASKDFGIRDKEELNAIMYHTTGKRNMAQIEKVIYASDKIDPTRGYDSSDFIKEMKVNIDKGFMMVLKANKEFFIQKGISYDNRLTKECMEYYLG